MPSCSRPSTLDSRLSLPAPERLARGLYWDRAWSLVDGCSPRDSGCANCWAAADAKMRAHNPVAAIAERYQGLVDKCGHFNGTVRTHPELLPKPLRAKRPWIWSVWTDLLHPAVPNELISAAMDVIADVRSEWHRFLICTKRPERWQAWIDWHDDHWPGDSPFNVGRQAFDLGAAEGWYIVPRGLPLLIGTTVGDQAAMHLVEELAASPLALVVPMFLSIEPLLGPLHFDRYTLGQFHWAIVGCESGPRRRPCKLQWIQGVVDQLREAGVRVFIKQIPDARGRVVRRLEDFPRSLQFRELPASFGPQIGRRA